MKKRNIIILMALILVSFTDICAQKKNDYIPPGGARLMVQIDGNDTVFLAFIHDIYVFPRQRFKNKAQEQFFWRTVRDVKKTLPFAKLVASELTKTNMKLAALPNDKVRKQYLSQFEKEVFKKYEADLKKMSINQGRLLLKLIDRECEQSSYDLIKIYRGSITAFFWQGVARVFGSNLKDNYDASDKDKMLERVILLVEAGQL
ncbi:MAG TPA: DUF4294 domain-containing protein [Paludibacter sp.]